MINLLPPGEKHKIYAGLFRQQLINITLLLIVVFVGGSVLFLNTVAFLKIQTRELNKQLAFEEANIETKEAQTLENDIKNLNNLLVKYQSFRNQYRPVANVFRELEKVVPPSVSLRVLSFDVVTHRVVISGFSPTREAVLALENRLKTSPTFERIESPLSNFLESTDIDFSFSLYAPLEVLDEKILE